MKQTTLCLLIKDNKILLAMKKRGFGVGRWNGYGGKFEPEKDKNILDAAIRETKEEIGVDVKNMEKFGLFRFRFDKKKEWNQDVHLFVVRDWAGEPSESEEMLPKWFLFKEIPYENMWPDDKHWLPHVLKGEKVEADFLFGEGDKVLNHKIKIVGSWL
ncbi:MAG: 8-oxo-dGTP diphosphatase [Candidatus Staskawiczbacteria bacterium]|nr:8-oxo-dGTP diphosphatase [Candidatus Staskawiczbacteria bacterium]